MKRRDFDFDNYKGFLLLLVVIGHVLYPIVEEGNVAAAIYFFIFTFHMPAFIFISGYYSKRNDPIMLFKKLFVPYVIFQVILFIMDAYWFQEKDVVFSLFTPKHSLWYLLAIYFYRSIIQGIDKIKGVLAIAIVLSILVNFDTSLGYLFTFSRLVVFLPFFIMGYRFDKKKVDEFLIRYPVPVKFVAIFIVGAILTVSIILSKSVSSDLLKGAWPYIEFDSYSTPLFIRVWQIIGSVLMIGAIYVLVPKTENKLTYIGIRTLPIYIFHNLAQYALFHGTEFYDILPKSYEIPVLLAISFVMFLVFSLRPFDWIMNLTQSVPVELLVKEYEKGIKSKGEKNEKNHYLRNV